MIKIKNSANAMNKKKKKVPVKCVVQRGTSKKMTHTIWRTGVWPCTLESCRACACFQSLCLLGWFLCTATWQASLIGIWRQGETKNARKNEKICHLTIMYKSNFRERWRKISQHDKSKFSSDEARKFVYVDTK